MKRLLLVLLVSACCAQINNGGGGGSSSTTITGAINATGYGVKADGHIVAAPSFTNTSNIVTCTLCNFTGTDAQSRPNAAVGQIVFGTNATTDVSALTSVLVTPECLIQSIDSATQIHMGTVGSIGTACNATASTTTSGFVIWGDLDSATSSQSPSTANDPMLNAWTAAANNCQALILPSGVMLIERGEFNTNSTGTCSNANSTTFLRAGYGVQGQGPANTIIVPTPNFVTADCSTACFFGAKANPQLQNFQITGVGNSTCGAGFNGKSLVQITGDATGNGTNFSLRHVIFQAWCANQTGTIGLQIGTGANTISGGTISDSVIETFGSTGTNTNFGGSGNGAMIQVSNDQFTGCGASGSCLVVNGGIWSSSHSFYGFTASTTNNAILCNSTSTCIFDGDQMPYQTGTGVSQIGCITCILKLINSNLNGGWGGIGTGGTTSLYLQNSIIGASNSPLGCAGASVVCNVYDEGGNTITSIVTGGGGVQNFWLTGSTTGTACTTGNWALTSGWSTSSVATAQGDSHRCHVTITGAAGSAGPVLTWTYPKAYLVAPLSCQLTGLNASLTGVIAGVPAASTVAFTFTGTPTAVTYTFDASCGP